jgi:hypothetical protein
MVFLCNFLSKLSFKKNSERYYIYIYIYIWNVHGLHLSTRYSLLVKIKLNFNILHRFSENIQISNFMKIRPVGAELFHTDGRTDTQDEANSTFSQFWESA